MNSSTSSGVERAAQRLEAAAAEFFAVQDVTLGLPAQPEVIRLRGRLSVASEQAYLELAKRFRQEGYAVILRHDSEQDLDVLLAAPEVQAPKRSPRLWINAVLYVLTVLSTLWAGTLSSGEVPESLQGGQALLWALTHLWVGWPFALSIMTILTGHELGHYFASRHYKVAATLPYFIPLPISPLGTMGAVIAMQERTANRRHMLGIAVAGPLTGLLLTLPILIIGLMLSEVQPIHLVPGEGAFYEGNSILYLLLKLAVFGKILPGSGVLPSSLAQALSEAGAAILGTFPLDRGYDVFIHPVAWAGWAGLLVTALNLLPVGQLDGGHVIYCLIGQRARLLTWPIMGLCLVMGLLFWSGWLLWAALIFLFGQGHPDPLDDVTRLGRGGKILAVVMLIVFVLTFTPVPFREIPPELPGAAAGESAGCLAGVGLILGASWLAWRARRRGCG